MSHPNTEADVDRIARGLIDLSLPKREWTHAAHFAAAFWLLRERGEAALCEMAPLIRAYNERTGVENTDTGGYHETITLASLRVARAWLGDRPGVPLHEALNDLLASSYGRSDWPLAYWSRELLFSVAARRGWIDPDVRPFPY